jgi:hypothetical protein
MDEIIKKLNEFRDQRNWKQFHQPKNLAMSIMIENTQRCVVYSSIRPMPGYT